MAENGKIIWLSGYRPTGGRLNADGSFDSTFPGFHLAGHEGQGGYAAKIRSIGDVAYVYANFFSINGAVVHALNRIHLDTPPRTGIDIQFAGTFSGYGGADLQTIGENDGLLTVNVRRLG